MNRVVEWALATVGAAVCIGGAILIGQGQSELWPMPALVLIEMALLGLAGLVAVALDDGTHAVRWDLVIWVVCGGLTALMLIGAASLGPLLFIAVVAFLGAAILANRRRNRNLLSGLGIYVIGAASNAVVIFMLILAVRH